MSHITNTVRELRKTATKAEELLWKHVRNKKFQNLRFLRQHPIKFKFECLTWFLVADFYCAKHKLIIEIDGKIHDNQQEYDELRTYILNVLGYKVIRFRNEDIIDDIEKVITQLLNFIKE